MTTPKITEYPDTAHQIREALKAKGWRPGYGGDGLIRSLIDGCTQSLIVDHGEREGLAPIAWSDEVAIVTHDEHGEAFDHPLAGRLDCLFEARRLDEPAQEPRELLMDLRHFQEAADRILEDLERAERIDRRTADAFAGAYPFAQDFAELPGQIADWRRKAAAMIHDQEQDRGAAPPDRIRCEGCGIPIANVPEDSDPAARFCDRCDEATR